MKIVRRERKRAPSIADLIEACERCRPAESSAPPKFQDSHAYSQCDTANAERVMRSPVLAEM